MLCILGCALCACAGLAAKWHADGNEFEWPFASETKSYAATPAPAPYYGGAADSSRDGPNYNAAASGVADESGAWPSDSPAHDDGEYTYDKKDDADMADMDMSDDESAYARI